MLATPVPEPFNRPGWAYEEKYDGDRILAYREDNRVRLLSRNEKDRTDKFPRIAAAIRALKPVTLLLDGEVVVFDKKGISRFQLLQQDKGDPVYAIFGCLFHEGKDLRHEPLSTRRTVMERSIGLSKLLLPSRRLATNGLHAFRIAQRRGYEGLVAKDLSSP
jgi:bifunctional non-homologous end joining protein LigD